MLDQILQNHADTIEIDVYYNNVLTTPTSIKIHTLTDSSGVIRGTDLAVDAGATTGRYSYTVPADVTNLLGLYTALWEFVIGGVTYQHEQNFKVVVTVKEGYTTPSEVRAISTYGNITATEPTDAVLQKYIDLATQSIDVYLGGSAWLTTYNETRRCVLDHKSGGLHVQLLHVPIGSVSSMSIMTLPSSVTSVDVTNLRVNERAGYLELFSSSSAALTVCLNTDWTAGNVIPETTVIYTAGFESVPEDFRNAAVKYVETLYRTDLGDNKELSSFTLGDQKETYKRSDSTESSRKKLGLDPIGMIEKTLKNYMHPNEWVGIAGIRG